MGRGRSRNRRFRRPHAPVAVGFLGFKGVRRVVEFIAGDFDRPVGIAEHRRWEPRFRHDDKACDHVAVDLIEEERVMDESVDFIARYAASKPARVILLLREFCGDDEPRALDCLLTQL
jgi:hypothetical protein